MSKGDKSSYSSKQKRQAKHIAEGYRKRGTSAGTAKRRAWATVNKETGGGKLRGSGRGKKATRASSRKGGKIGGRVVSAVKRRVAARKAARTRARKSA
jgi:hypothetical protein